MKCISHLWIIILCLLMVGCKERLNLEQGNVTMIDVDMLKKYAGVSTNTFKESFSFVISDESLKTNNIIVSCESSYTSSDNFLFPTIMFRDRCLASHQVRPYIIGGRELETFKQWRYLKLLGDSNAITVSFDIPSGVELTIDSFSIHLDNSITRDGFKFYEHDGYWAGTFNSSLAFQQSDAGSYYGAIVVPKLTTDGVFVCYHDDNTLSNNNDLQMIGGKYLSDELGALRMNQLSYAQTQMLEYKVTNILDEHSRIPTLESFFEFCANTGVHPCLSCHPTYTVAQWTLIKDLAERYRLLDNLTIKHGADLVEMQEVFQVFGNSIEMYLWDISTSALESYIEDLQMVNWDLSKVAVGVEFMDSMYAFGALDCMSNLTSLGYVWGVYENTPDIAVLTALIEEGCFEWTIGAFFSNGLNW